MIYGEHCWGGHATYAVAPARNVVRRPAAGAGRSWPPTRWPTSRPTGCSAAPGCGPATRCSSSASAAACRPPPWPSAGGWAPRSWPRAAARPSASRRWPLGAVAAYDSAERAWPVEADVVVESVGPATWEQSVRALKAGGRLVVCGGTSGPKVELNLPRLFFKQIEIIGSTMGSYQEFAELTDLVARLADPGRRGGRPGRLPGRPGAPRARPPARQDRATPRLGPRHPATTLRLSALGVIAWSDGLSSAPGRGGAGQVA